jgi:hypothetical protein
MSLSLDEYRIKLINHIQHAESQDEVNRYINTAIKALEHNKVNGHIITRFVDKILGELDEFSPMNKDAQHWSNIKMAKILFNRIKNKLNTVVS